MAKSGKNDQGQGPEDTLMEDPDGKEKAEKDNDKDDKDEPAKFADTLSSPLEKSSSKSYQGTQAIKGLGFFILNIILSC